MKTLKSFLILSICVVSVLSGYSQHQLNLDQEKKQISVFKQTDTNAILRSIKNGKSIMPSHFDSAMQIFTQALVESRQAGFKHGITLSTIGLAILYMNSGELDRSRTMFFQILNAPDSDIDDKITGALYVNIANIHVLKGNYDSAYISLDAALNYIDKEKDPNALAIAYFNISSILKSMEEPQKALQYLKRAEHLAEKQKDSATISGIYNNYSSIYLNMDMLDTALYYNDLGLAFNKQSNNKKRTINAYIIRANIYRKLQRDDEAFKHLKNALTLSNEYNPNDYQVMSFIQLSLAELYIKRKDYRNAYRYIYPALYNANKINALTTRFKAYKALASLSNETGDFQEAYKNLLAAQEVQDTILNKEKHKTINELETKYRTAEKDNKLVLQQMQLTEKSKAIQQRNFWIGIIIAGGTLIVVFASFIHRSRAKLQLEKIKTMEKENKINQLQAIMKGEEKERLRIANDLHDGIASQLMAVKLRFSSLLRKESPVIDKQKLEEGFSYLDIVMQDLRKTAHNLRPESVLHKGLVTALREFCIKMDDDHTTKIHFLNNGYIKIDANFELLLYRIIQELVQNAIKYAQAETLLVQLNYHEKLLEITIEDDGVGFVPQEALAKMQGLYSIQERINTMNGYMEINSQIGEGATIYFEIPIQTHIKSNENAY